MSVSATAKVEQKEPLNTPPSLSTTTPIPSYQEVVGRVLREPPTAYLSALEKTLSADNLADSILQFSSDDSKDLSATSKLCLKSVTLHRQKIAIKKFESENTPKITLPKLKDFILGRNYRTTVPFVLILNEIPAEIFLTDLGQRFPNMALCLEWERAPTENTFRTLAQCLPQLQSLEFSNAPKDTDKTIEYVSQLQNPSFVGAL